MTAVMTPRPDPFTDAACHQPTRLPRWWDPEAKPDERLLAAAICRTCPAVLACAEAADKLGGQAAGTWAGRYRRFDSSSVVDDEAMAEFLAVFGPSAVTSDNPMPTTPAPKPVKDGRYWIHPHQLRIKYQETK